MEVNDQERGTLVEGADDVFKEAFDQAEAAEESPAVSAADDPATTGQAAPEPPAAPAAPAAEPPAAAEPPTPNDDEPYEQRFKTLKGIHKHDQEEWAKERAKLLQDLEAAKKPPEAPVDKGNTPPVDLDDLSDEEKEALREYDEEFDLVSKMEGKKREVALKKLMNTVTAEIATLRAEFQNRLSPVDALVEKTQKDAEAASDAAHFSAIKEAHADFEKYRDDKTILQWIEGKPGYLQKGLMQIYQKGTAEDVIDLITDFKAENNITTTPPSNVVDMNQKKEQRRMANTAVVTKRGAINTQGAVATNFEGAWDEAVNKGG